MKRYFEVAIPVAITFICFGYSVDAWFAAVRLSCDRFKDLSAECFAPHSVAALTFCVGIGLSQLALAWLALRNKSQLDGK